MDDMSLCVRYVPIQSDGFGYSASKLGTFQLEIDSSVTDPRRVQKIVDQSRKLC